MYDIAIQCMCVCIATCVFVILCSYFLFSISHPSKTGIPSIDLSADADMNELPRFSTSVQKSICRVAQKVFAQHGVKVKITEQIFNRFKVKLWRMGQLLDKHRGGNQRAAILRRWQNEEWELLLDREDLHEDTIRGMLEKK